MRDLVLFLAFFGTMPAVLIHPHVGVLVWAWFSYMNPHRLIPWGISYDFRFAFICFAVTAFAWFWSREPKKLPWKMTTVLLIALLVWMSVTTVFAVNPELAAIRWEKVTKILIMTFATLALLQNRERIHAFVWVIVVGIGFFGVKGGIWAATGGAAGSGSLFGPPGSFISDNNQLALALVMTIPLIIYLYQQSQLIWVRAGLLAASFLCVASLIGSFSRGAFVAAGVVGLTLVLRSRKRLLISIIVLISVVGIGVTAPERWVDRIQSITEYQEDNSALGRIRMWKFAWNLALDRPVFGGGFDAFANPAVFNQYATEGTKPRAYHSIYFQVLGDHGFVGLAIFLLLGFSGFLSVRRVKKLTFKRPDLAWANDLARMVEVSLAGFAVGGLFYSLAIFDLYYHLLVLTLLVRIVVEREIGVSQPQQLAPTPGIVASNAGNAAARKFNV